MLKAGEVACKVVARLASGLKKCTSLAKLSVHAGVVSVTASVTVTVIVTAIATVTVTQ